MTKTLIVISGALGRMGREIAAIICADPQTQIVGALEYPSHPQLDQKYSTLTAFECGNVIVTDTIPAELKEAVIIDFSSPQGTRNLVELLQGSSHKLVVGTTSLTNDDVDVLKGFAKTNAVVYSPNMSIGVNLLFTLTEMVAKKLGTDFDIEIIETHHRFKKDSPSGTARRLGEIAAEALEQSYDEAIRNGRDGIVGERTKKEVGMHAVRGGDVVGDHTVLFAGPGERLELTHKASNRATFAHGAVTAAKWVANKKTGFYSMHDVLGM